MAIGIAVLGAGTSGRDHVRAIAKNLAFDLRAVYSRSQASAEVVGSSATVDAYFDSEDPAHSLDALFARGDIAAVTIALPIPIQPDFIKKAIQARKHVLSERPIAKDVQTAKALIEWYEDGRKDKGFWSVGESYRFMESVMFGRKVVRDYMTGPVQTFSLKTHTQVGEVNTSCETPGPCSPQHQGGSILDSGLHLVAALRLIVADPSESITQVAAFTSLSQGSFSPRDTANAIMQFSNGSSGTFNMSLGMKLSVTWEIEVTKESGTVTVSPYRVILRTGQNVQTRDFSPEDRLEREVAVFAEGIKRAKIEIRGTPEAALEDLKVVQAILESGQEGGVVKRIQ